MTTESSAPKAAASASSASIAELTDREAIDRVLAGEADTFRILVERYQGRAHGLALRVLRNDEAARDAVQDAFVKAYSNLGKFEGRSSFYTWFYRLVMNQCLDAKRRDKGDRHVEFEEGGAVEQNLEASEPIAPEVAGVSFAPAADLMRKELRAHLARAIEQLPDDARETLVLREVEGLSYKEIAEALEIPKGTVMSRLHYARKQLQLILVEAGVAGGESE
jgi:RNA polymerase sigma-70 factor (ECF subfamily)